MGESECDAERGTAKISLGFHKILKIQCVPCTNPMSALQQWKRGVESKNGYDHQYSVHDSGKEPVQNF